jgi:hypothetical protein
VDDTGRIAAYEFFAGRLADTFKMIGAANGSSFLAAVVAFTYFPQKPEMTVFLKRLSLSYLGGLFVFILAYVVLNWFFATQTPHFYGRTNNYEPTFSSPLFSIALLLAGGSLGAWVYASIRVGIALFKFSRYLRPHHRRDHLLICSPKKRRFGVSTFDTSDLSSLSSTLDRDISDRRFTRR